MNDLTMALQAGGLMIGISLSCAAAAYLIIKPLMMWDARRDRKEMEMRRSYNRHPAVRPIKTDGVLTHEDFAMTQSEWEEAIRGANAGEHHEVALCVDCAHEDAWKGDWISSTHPMSLWDEYNTSLHVNFDAKYFSWDRCDGCGDTKGGDRWVSIITIISPSWEELS